MALAQRLMNLTSSVKWAPRDLRWRSEFAREFGQSQWESQSAVEEMALERLRRLLHHAVSRCPYYRRISDRLGIGPEEMRQVTDLARWPILQKSDILAHGAELQAEGWNDSDMIWSASSGTTGPRIEVLLHHSVLSSRTAAMWRHDGWAGWSRGQRRALLWGSAGDLWPRTGWRSRARWLLTNRNLLGLDATELSAANAKDYVRELRAFRPRTMLVFAQHLTRFAGYLRDAGLQPPQLEAIIVTAEVLRGRDRQLITSVFGCPVFGRYGSRETGVIASQCSENSHMHINAESVVVEFVRDNQHVAPGELGEVLVTDLRNYAMPLVRYRIGDVAAPQQGPCECGRGLPLMGPVVGRTADFITCPDGRLVNGVSLVSDLEASTSVSQAQIRQSEPGRLVVRLVPAEAFSRSAIDRLGAWLACHVSDRLVYGVEIVQEIPFERPSGKFRFVVSEIPPERLFGNTMTSAMAA